MTPGRQGWEFKRNPRGHLHIDWIDPRRLEISLDAPLWRASQAQAAQEVAPSVEFSDECHGRGPSRRDFGPVEIEARGAAEQGGSEVAERHGITGLVLGAETEIRPARR